MSRSLLLSALLAVLAAAGPVRAEERGGQEVEDLFLRAGNDEDPTPEGQRVAQRLLRDWRLSERTFPSSERRTEAMLLAMAEGQRLPPELAARARELHRDYFTPEGRELRQRQLAAAAGRRPGDPLSAATETSLGDWFLLGVSVLILVGGVAVSAFASRRKRSDNNVYYR